MVIAVTINENAEHTDNCNEIHLDDDNDEDAIACLTMNITGMIPLAT